MEGPMTACRSAALHPNCYELTKVFNQFYHDYSILNEPDEHKKAVRLMLAKNVAKIIKTGMGLLGIEVPERM